MDIFECNGGNWRQNMCNGKIKKKNKKIIQKNIQYVLADMRHSLRGNCNLRAVAHIHYYYFLNFQKMPLVYGCKLQGFIMYPTREVVVS